MKKTLPTQESKNPHGRVAVIVSEWNSDITTALLAGLEAEFEQYPGVQWQVHRVPGAFEIPQLAQRLASMVQVFPDESEERIFDVIVALGCVIKGKTLHFELIAKECARGCMDVSLQQGIPVVFEVLACFTHKDAVKRSTGKGNHGKLAAQVALSWLDQKGDEEQR